jgi:hypothetical protein
MKKRTLALSRNREAKWPRNGLVMEARELKAKDYEPDRTGLGTGLN